MACSGLETPLPIRVIDSAPEEMKDIVMNDCLPLYNIFRTGQEKEGDNQNTYTCMKNAQPRRLFG